MTIAMGDPVAWASASHGFAVQTRLNGSSCCLGWRLLGTQGTQDGGLDFPREFDATFAIVLLLSVMLLSHLLSVEDSLQYQMIQC